MKELTPIDGWKVLHDQNMRVLPDALKALTSDEPVMRWHARCWLAYRRTEGCLGLPQWQEAVSGHVLPELVVPEEHARWMSSLTAAECSAYCVSGMRERAMFKMEQMRADGPAWLQSWPSGVSNYLRVMALHACDEHLQGRSARGIIEEAVAQWRRVMAGFDHAKHPMRFFDVRLDAKALLALMCLGQRIGLMDRPYMEDMRCKIFEGPQELWTKALQALSRHERNVFLLP